jgi:hypothetical protein
MITYQVIFQLVDIRNTWVALDGHILRREASVLSHSKRTGIHGMNFEDHCHGASKKRDSHGNHHTDKAPTKGERDESGPHWKIVFFQYTVGAVALARWR